MAVIEVNAGNVLILHSECKSNFKILNVVSRLTLSDGQAETPAARNVVSTIGFGQTARMTYGFYAVSLASSLGFTQFAHPHSNALSVYSYLQLTQSADRPKFEAVVSTLTLSHSVDGQGAIGNLQTLELTQVAIGNLFRAETLVHSLQFESLVGCYIENSSFYLLQTPLPTPPARELITPPV